MCGGGVAVPPPEGVAERPLKVAAYGAFVNLHVPRMRVERALPPGSGTGRWVRITATGNGTMSGVFKSIEMVGTSGSSFEDAVRHAVKRAAESMRDLEWMEVVEQRGYIRGGDIHEYQVKVKLWFKLEDGAQS